MTIKIISNCKYPKYQIKKKTNIFLDKKNKDWIDHIYLFDGGILFRLFDRGVSMDSLYDTDEIYTLVCEYIEFMFFNTEITIYGEYNIDKFSQVKGVRITEI